MKKKIFILIKILIAIGLLAFLIYRIGPNQLKVVFFAVNAGYIFLLYGLLALDAIFRSFNWMLLLKVKSHKISLGEIIYNYMVGSFFGTFLPSSLGTDMMRAFLLSQRNKINMLDSTLSLLVLNLMALLSLCILGTFSSIYLLNIKNYTKIAWLIIAICGAYILLFPLLMRGWIPNVASEAGRWVDKTLNKIGEMSTALRNFNDHRAIMINVLGVTFLNQILTTLMVYMISLSLRLDVSILLLMAYVPLITISRLIPFSIAGFGAEQGVFVLLFAQAGIPAAEAFLVSIMLSLTVLSFSLLGGGIYAAKNILQLLQPPKISAERNCGRRKY